MENSGLIYKYAPINDFTKESIKESYLWFSPASNLNDPFDLKYQLSPNFIREIAEKSANNPNKEVIDQFIEKMQNERHRENFMRAVRAFAQYSICCFTEKEDDILMWSHYAEKHTGVCLIYDSIKMPQSLGIFRPVIYSEKYPICNSYNEVNNKAIFTKSTHWSYEREWRIAKFMEKGKIGINREHLKGIIFGRNASLENMKEIFNICKQSEYNDLDYFGMGQSTNEYKLIIAKANQQILDKLDDRPV